MRKDPSMNTRSWILVWALSSVVLVSCVFSLPVSLEFAGLGCSGAATSTNQLTSNVEQCITIDTNEREYYSCDPNSTYTVYRYAGVSCDIEPFYVGTNQVGGCYNDRQRNVSSLVLCNADDPFASPAPAPLPIVGESFPAEGDATQCSSQGYARYHNCSSLFYKVSYSDQECQNETGQAFELLHPSMTPGTCYITDPNPSSNTVYHCDATHYTQLFYNSGCLGIPNSGFRRALNSCSPGPSGEFFKYFCRDSSPVATPSSDANILSKMSWIFLLIAMSATLSTLG